ncbi:UDP-N-acetylglucosamine 2-epimerase [Lutibacter sp.]|uniref:UDP-N-acetylglucosamine 2-epimerase n=1 Tax=Lutibacter sp. TaxID=1925666 RepID=UPI0025BD8F87|nr:UDP-N-acetylglucosamine 2-epimerase [Lutibacter sp.]MCF6181132.1 UDP-N-acetylglucosamine 2-epimerase [Lutibacter sp.]
MKFLIYISLEYGFPIVRPLQVEILKRGYKVAWYIENEISKRKLKLSEKLLNTVKEVMDFKPDAVLVASNEVPHFFPGIKVQLFHGFSVNKRTKDKGHFRIRGFFDLYCTQGPSTTTYFKELEIKYKYFKVVETGWSKVDVLFPVLKKIVTSKPTIFIASTFTERLSLAHNSAVFKELVSLIESEDWNWIVNLHPKMDAKIVNKFQQLNSYKNVKYLPFLEDLEPLKQADVMFTDTSSIITEFIIQKKPVITFNNNLPKDCFINISTVDNLKSNIELALKRPEDLMAKIEKFVLDEHPYFDGKSSERVLDATLNFLDKDQSSLKRKPLNLLRKYQMRKKMNYFKF